MAFTITISMVFERVADAVSHHTKLFIYITSIHPSIPISHPDYRKVEVGFHKTLAGIIEIGIRSSPNRDSHSRHQKAVE